MLSAQMGVQQRAFFRQDLLSNIWAPQPALPQCGETTGTGVGSANQYLEMPLTVPSESSPVLRWKSWNARTKCVCFGWLFYFSIDSHPSMYSWPSLLPLGLTHSSVLPKYRRPCRGESDPLALGAGRCWLKAELGCRHMHSLSFSL